MKCILFSMMLLGIGQWSFAQVSGNQVYSRGSRNHQSQQRSFNNRLTKLALTDSTLLIEAKVLKNVKADHYVAVFSLHQEAKTVKACNSKINDRVNRFVSNVKKLGIKEDEIYTDLIDQKQVYDISRGEAYNTEYLKGFELSKNVIIKYNKPSQIEEMLTLAAQDSIFDLVKVDYIIQEMDKVYDELFITAKDVLTKKKQRYLDLTNAKLTPKAQIYLEDYSSIYPSDAYSSYTQATVDYVENNSWSKSKETKRIHKYETFYFDPISYSGFDKVINPMVLEPQVQIMLTLQVKYEMQK